MIELCNVYFGLCDKTFFQLMIKSCSWLKISKHTYNIINIFFNLQMTIFSQTFKNTTVRMAFYNHGRAERTVQVEQDLSDAKIEGNIHQRCIQGTRRQLPSDLNLFPPTDILKQSLSPSRFAPKKIVNLPLCTQLNCFYNFNHQ